MAQASEREKCIVTGYKDKSQLELELKWDNTWEGERGEAMVETFGSLEVEPPEVNGTSQTCPPPPVSRKDGCGVSLP